MRDSTVLCTFVGVGPRKASIAALTADDACSCVIISEVVVVVASAAVVAVVRDCCDPSSSSGSFLNTSFEAELDGICFVVHPVSSRMLSIGSFLIVVSHPFDTGVPSLSRFWLSAMLALIVCSPSKA